MQIEAGNQPCSQIEFVSRFLPLLIPPVRVSPLTEITRPLPRFSNAPNLPQSDKSMDRLQLAVQDTAPLPASVTHTTSMADLPSDVLVKFQVALAAELLHVHSRAHIKG